MSAATPAAALRGYAYRLPKTDRDTLRDLAATWAALPAWQFGAVALWDMATAQGRDTLRPITPVDAAAQLNFSGDFGHVFSPAGEARWRRVDNETYDVLLLAEQPDQALVQRYTLHQIGLYTAVVVPPGAADLINMHGERRRLERVEYRRDDLAVELIRYTKLT